MSLRILIVTRNQPQHFALIDAIQDTNTLCGGVIQMDENNYMKAPHLSRMIDADKASIKKYFGIKYSHMSNVKTVAINADDMNSDNTINFINDLSPDIVLFFDSERMTNENLNKINAKKWQMFLGNIEINKGFFSNAITNIQNKPEQTCITLHEMTDNSDSGNIIHQTRASLREIDTTNDLEARSFRIMLNDIPEIVSHTINNTLKTKVQNNQGVYNDENSFTADMLSTLFDKYNNNIYKCRLDNNNINEQNLSNIQLFNGNTVV